MQFRLNLQKIFYLNGKMNLTQQLNSWKYIYIVCVIIQNMSIFSFRIIDYEQILLIFCPLINSDIHLATEYHFLFNIPSLHVMFFCSNIGKALYLDEKSFTKNMSFSYSKFTLCIVISSSKINTSFSTSLTLKMDIKIDDIIKIGKYILIPVK